MNNAAGGRVVLFSLATCSSLQIPVNQIVLFCFCCFFFNSTSLLFKIKFYKYVKKEKEKEREAKFIPSTYSHRAPMISSHCLVRILQNKFHTWYCKQGCCNQDFP